MIDKLKTIGITELILGEIIILILFWLSDEFLALLLSIMVTAISFGVLIISLIAEKIEKSKVSKKYFITIFLLGFTPIAVGAIFYFVNQGISFE